MDMPGRYHATSATPAGAPDLSRPRSTFTSGGGEGAGGQRKKANLFNPQRPPLPRGTKLVRNLHSSGAMRCLRQFLVPVFITACVLSLSTSAHAAPPVEGFVQLGVGGQDVPADEYGAARASIGLRGAFSEHLALSGWVGLGHAALPIPVPEAHARGWDVDFGLAGELQTCSVDGHCLGFRLGGAAQRLDYLSGDQDPQAHVVWMIAPSLGPYVSFGRWVVAFDLRPAFVVSHESSPHGDYEEHGRTRMAGYLNVGLRF
jgi:hypothetical protein